MLQRLQEVVPWENELSTELFDMKGDRKHSDGCSHDDKYLHLDHQPG